MTITASNTTVDLAPFIGPRPFETGDRDLFFGRDREAHEICSLLLANRLLLLYAVSGAGKTSLFNAGVRPLIEDDLDILPIARLQRYTGPGYADVANVYTQSVLAGWAEPADLNRLRNTTLAQFLTDRPRRLIESIDLPMPRLLVFDQFEELFTIHPDQWQKRRMFLEQLAEAIKSDPDLRVLIIMREDFLAQLLGYADTLFGGLKDRYFLEPLRKSAAELAISEPVNAAGRSFGPGATDHILRLLMATRVEIGDGSVRDFEGEFVDSILLQVYCQMLWNSVPPTVRMITESHVKNYADVGTSLRRYYSDAVQEAARVSELEEKQVRSWVGQKLLTSPGGTRSTVHVGPKRTAGLPNKAVHVLEGKILRTEFRAGAQWVEITHDSLLAPIEQSNAEFKRSRRLSGQNRRIARNTIALILLFALAAVVLTHVYGTGGPATLVALFVGGGAPAGVYVAWGFLRRPRKSETQARVSADVDDERIEIVLDQWAKTIRKQWGYEYEARTYNDPSLIHRDIRASWSAADDSLTPPWSTLTEVALGPGAYQGMQPAKWATRPEALAGLDEVDLQQILEKVPTGWLVVLGESGSGKTMLMLRTLLEILDRRAVRDPVPVIVPMASWNPADDSLLDWLGKRLPIDYPGLGANLEPGDPGTTIISMLLDRQKIMPILDGLDEMPAKARKMAISQLDLAFADARRPLQLAVTCRTAEYADAVGRTDTGRAHHPLEAAAVIELHPLDIVKVSNYLGRRGGDRRWARVEERLRDDPRGILIEALDTPLYASLASEIYNLGRARDVGEARNPEELCDRPDVQSVQVHLLDEFIPAVYAKERSDEERRAANRGEEPRQLSVERWLMILAHYLTHGQKGQTHPRPDLEWWNLRGLAPGWLVPLVMGVVCAVPTAVAAAIGTHVGVGIGIGFGTGILIAIGIGVLLLRARQRWDRSHISHTAFRKRYANRRPGPGMAGGMIGAVIGAVLAGVAGQHHIGHQASLFSGIPEALGMALGAGAATDFLGGLVGVLIGAFVGGYLAAVGLGLPAGLVNGIGVGVAVAVFIDQLGRRRPSRTVPKWDAWIGIAGGSVIGLAIGATVWREAGATLGVVLGVLVAALAAAPFGLRHTDETLENVPSPAEALARDVKAFRLTAISAGLAAGAAGFLGGSMTSIFDVHGKATLGSVLNDGLGIGITAALVVGLTFGFYHAASPEFRITTWWLAIQHKAPWRFMRFLGRAYALTVLRQSGAAYQFRYLELQLRLDARYTAAEEQRKRLN
jgi:hypothetical protein